MSNKVTLTDLRERMIGESRKDNWWLARNGVTYRSPMSLQSIELTLKKNPQGDYQVCHVRDDGEDENSWFDITLGAAPARKVESRGNTTIFRASAPVSKSPASLRKEGGEATKPMVTDQPMAQPASVSPQKSVTERMEELTEAIARLESKVDRILLANDQLTDLERLSAGSA